MSPAFGQENPENPPFLEGRRLTLCQPRHPGDDGMPPAPGTFGDAASGGGRNHRHATGAPVPFHDMMARHA